MKKYYAKPDQIYLTDHKEESAPVDDFKANRQIKLKRGHPEDKNWDKPNSKPIPPSLDNSTERKRQ